MFKNMDKPKRKVTKMRKITKRKVTVKLEKKKVPEIRRINRRKRLLKNWFPNY